MHVCTIPARQSGKPHVASLAQALKPGTYLALRRQAAGYSVDAFARALLLVAEHYAPARPAIHGRVPAARPTLDESRARFRKMRDTVTLLESPNGRTNDADLLWAIASLFPFNRAVYHQLATAPANRHPRVCRGCGCSDHDACVDIQDHVCSLLTPDLCSHCVTGSVASVAGVEAA